MDDGTGVITVSLAKRSVEADPLFVQIDRRQTNRSVYSDVTMPRMSAITALDETTDDIVVVRVSIMS